MIFGTMVKVIAGFYLGCTGTVVGKGNFGLIFKDIRFYVNMTCSTQQDTKIYFDTWISEKDISAGQGEVK